MVRWSSDGGVRVQIVGVVVLVVGAVERLRSMRMRMRMRFG